MLTWMLWKLQRLFVTFLTEHGKSSHYVFQLKKCNRCTYCTVINPPRIPADEFDELHFLPDPIPGENDHYLSFKEVYGRNTREEHRPGALIHPEENANDKRHRDLFKNGKVREVIMCGECSKPRCIYSERKLTREQEELLLRLSEERFYTCGDPLVHDDTEEIEFVVREGISCVTPIETCYFSASLKHYLPPVCIHCGSTEDLLDDNDPYISALYEQFSVVRPICDACRRSGKDTKTWGKKFVSKRGKR